MHTMQRQPDDFLCISWTHANTVLSGLQAERITDDAPVLRLLQRLVLWLWLLAAVDSTSICAWSAQKQLPLARLGILIIRLAARAQHAVPALVV
jgi:hypothetical protein